MRKELISPLEIEPQFLLLTLKRSFLLNCMDFLIALFSVILFTLALGVTYHWGIKPDREQKKRQAAQAHAELRRRHFERSRARPGQQRRSTHQSSS